MEHKEQTSQKVIKFRRALRELFKSDTGATVIKFLEEAYVDTPCLDTSAELTYYRLGQKEFVQGLIKEATSEESVIEVISTDGVKTL